MMLAKRKILKDISNEGKESPKTLDCNNSKCDDVEFFSTSEEEDVEIVCVKFDDSYPMEENRRKSIRNFKRKVEEGLYEYRSDHFYTHYNYLSDNTKSFLGGVKGSHIEVKENAQRTRRE